MSDGADDLDDGAGALSGWGRGGFWSGDAGDPGDGSARPETAAAAVRGCREGMRGMIRPGTGCCGRHPAWAGGGFGCARRAELSPASPDPGALAGRIPVRRAATGEFPSCPTVGRVCPRLRRGFEPSSPAWGARNRGVLPTPGVSDRRRQRCVGKALECGRKEPLASPMAGHAIGPTARRYTARRAELSR